MVCIRNDFWISPTLMEPFASARASWKYNRSMNSKRQLLETIYSNQPQTASTKWSNLIWINIYISSVASHRFEFYSRCGNPHFLLKHKWDAFYDLWHARISWLPTNLCISLLQRWVRRWYERKLCVTRLRCKKKCGVLCKQVFRKFCLRSVSQLDHAQLNALCGRPGIWKQTNQLKFPCIL